MRLLDGKLLDLRRHLINSPDWILKGPGKQVNVLVPQQGLEDLVASDCVALDFYFD